jgi:hypothetical protein
MVGVNISSPVEEVDVVADVVAHPAAMLPPATTDVVINPRRNLSMSFSPFVDVKMIVILPARTSYDANQLICRKANSSIGGQFQPFLLEEARG